MGWSGGNDVYTQVARFCLVHGISEEKSIKALTELIHTLEDQDWDTADECYGISKASDEALNRCGWGQD
jgi:hypothetical protein